MGRPPSNGAPAFRFNPTEVAQMEAVLREHQGQIPARELLVALAEKFSNSPERAGKITVQMKQVWNWFQNRRYALRSKLVKSPGKLNISPMPREEVAPVRNVPPVPQQTPVSSGLTMVRSAPDGPQMEFEARSARDGAWYDVQAFLSHRYLETGNPEVRVRFSGFGPEEDEWVNVRKHVRQRSLPCEASECVAVLPGDLILCFQEGKEQALYFDAHVLDAQRRRHDIRGCRCRFLVRYDHDQSEEIVPLRKICRRPETDYRLQQVNAANEAASASVSAEQKLPIVDPASSSTFRVTTPNPTAAAIPVTMVHMTSAPTAPVSTPVPTQGPAPVPVPGMVPASDPVPVSVPAHVPVPVSVSAPVLSVPAPVISVPSAVPAPVSVPAPVPASVSVPAPVPVSVSVPAPVPVPASVSVPSPVPVPGPVAVSVSAADQGPVTVSTPGPVTASASEPKKADSDSTGVLAGGTATTEGNNTSAGAGTIALEPNKPESANPETATSSGSIDPVVTASELEKIDAGSSNVTVLAENVKE